MRYLVLFFLSMISTFSFCQKSASVGLRTGFVFYDLINQKEDTDDMINGYGSQFDIFVSYQYCFRKLNMVNSIGFTRLDNLDNNFYFTLERNPNRNRLLSNYINSSVGLRFPFKSEKVSFGTDLAVYFLAHKERINFTERRVFANLDISLNFVFNRVEFNLSTPLTVLPIYRENTIKSAYLSHAGEFVQINSFVEMIGLNLGCKIKIF